MLTAHNRFLVFDGCHTALVEVGILGNERVQNKQRPPYISVSMLLNSTEKKYAADLSIYDNKKCIVYVFLLLRHRVKTHHVRCWDFLLCGTEVSDGIIIKQMGGGDVLRKPIILQIDPEC